MCGGRLAIGISFGLLPVGLVPIPVPIPTPDADAVVCCVEWEDNVLKILLLSSLAHCDAAPAVAETALGGVVFLVDTSIILEKVNFTGLM